MSSGLLAWRCSTRSSSRSELDSGTSKLMGVGSRAFDGVGNFTQVTNEKGSLSGILFPNRAPLRDLLC